MSHPVPRNAPCPCGSGKKYKHCCLGKQSPGPSAGSLKRILPLVIVLLVVAVWAFAWKQRQRASARTSTPAAIDFQVPVPAAPVLPANPVGPTPQPYEYDAVNNRHWDPDHGHWHSGPPPTSPTTVTAPTAATAPAVAAAPTVTPAPYEYDPVTDRHWDPEHGHWHSGPPPADKISSVMSSEPEPSGN